MGREGSTLELYRSLLKLRADENLGQGTLQWQEGWADHVVAFTNGRITVIANTGESPVELPPGDVVVTTSPLEGGQLPGHTTVWVKNG